MTEFFKVTSTEPYDRHNYEIITNDESKIKFNDWNEMQTFWMMYSSALKTVLITDKKQSKKKGFGS